MIVDGYPRALTLVVAVGAATAGGVFFAFSTFVMTGLRALPGTQGLAAMQAINKAAPSPAFMAVLFGTALACVGLGISALTRLDELASLYQLVGSVAYLAGIVLTIAYHVPHNDALALVNPTNAAAADAWRHYASSWTLWNHVRTVTSLGAAVAFLLALRVD